MVGVGVGADEGLQEEKRKSVQEMNGSAASSPQDYFRRRAKSGAKTHFLTRHSSICGVTSGLGGAL